ncbi:DUF2860 family protein [uncultured Helicobacter sp.]|uniref:DUF2860 family protein n=1 Tax=uncultured Helicobacter sp. TaxID=175537 RepID=UPI00261B1D3F|nr:DUF2860 family protein [uncultured Helicobacter sp.]
MKKIVLGLCCFSAFAFCAEGFGGNISLGGGFKKLQSNINPSNDKHTIANYNQSNDDTEAIPFFGINLYYNGVFDDDKVFLKNYNSREVSGLSAGYGFNYGKNSTEIAFVGTFFEEAYANPYLTGANREVVDRTHYGIQIEQTYALSEINRIYGSYTFIKESYDKEDLDYDLLRKGDIHSFELGYEIYGLKLGLYYDVKDADSDAESYKGYGASISGEYEVINDTFVNASIEYGIKDFDGTNKIFNQTREANVLKLGVGARKEKIFGFQNAYAFANYLYGDTNDDIAFFDETYHIGIIGVGYKF